MRPELKAVIVDAPVHPQGSEPRERRGIIYGIHMRTISRQFRCERVSTSEAGEGFQVLFERTPDSDEGYVLVQRHFELPDREERYVESDDQEFSGHFRIRRAYLSRNGFRMAFGRNPVREIGVFCISPRKGILQTLPGRD